MTTRQLNRQRRDERIQELFRQRFSSLPRPRKFSREYVLAQLADEFCLSVATIEDIVYVRNDTPGPGLARPRTPGAGVRHPPGPQPATSPALPNPIP